MKEIVVLHRAHDEALDLVIQLNERQEGLGDRCCEALAEAYRRLSQLPETAPLSQVPPLRRLVIPRFSLGIFYSVQSSRIFIHAIIDLRQDPAFIRRRLID